MEYQVEVLREQHEDFTNFLSEKFVPIIMSNLLIIVKVERRMRFFLYS
ncbi:hypothetical protein [Lysinibacillus sp. FN11]|nr:hypothetical protein [Lysinibacillus sp. FN11]UUV26521.1 hypothetical protein NP781_07975 [Lysinibacillus sp. FN11]